MSLIQNINYLARNLSTLEKAKELLTPKAIKAMEAALGLSLEALVEDLKKGVSAEGKRKLDIDVHANSDKEPSSVEYDTITIYGVAGDPPNTYTLPTSQHHIEDLEDSIHLAIEAYNRQPEIDESREISRYTINLLQTGKGGWQLQIVDSELSEPTLLDTVVLHVTEETRPFAKSSVLTANWNATTSAILVQRDASNRLYQYVSAAIAAQDYALDYKNDAKDSAESSSTSSTTASLEAAKALNGAIRAGAEAARAQSSATVAQVSAGVYKSTVEGLASTTVGDIFGVVEGEYLSLFSHTADGAVLATQIPTAELTERLNRLIATDNKEDILIVVDTDYNSALRLDSAGGLHLVGADGPIQDYLPRIPDFVVPNIIGFSHKKDVLQIQDDEYSILVRVAHDGSIFIPNMKQSLQDRLGVNTLPRIYRYAAERLNPSGAIAMASLVSSSGNYAPCPLSLLPQNYTIQKEELLGMKLLDAPTPVVFDTPYRLDDGVVHPTLIEFHSGFLGFRYLVGITPYLTASDENPMLYGSNDLVNFELIQGFPQPLDTPERNGYMSDPNLSYDPVNGELVYLYRSNETVPSPSTSLKARTTKDGVHWEEPIIVLPMETYEEGGKNLSPALLYNPDTDLWMLWMGQDNSEVSLFTSAHLQGPWSLVKSNVLPEGVWHHEVKYSGNQYIMIAAAQETGRNFSIFTSDDGLVWEYHGGLFNEDIYGLYKPSMIPVFSESTLQFQVIWTDNVTRKAFTGLTTPVAYQVGTL